ncbi:MAG: DUF2029 domain-containing protein, partial [Planctomycetes bacterium]|nr:DUF2029 domain-containing protein [Planctomycetota bacterium]
MRRWWQPKPWWMWGGGALLLTVGMLQTPLFLALASRLLPGGGLRVVLLGLAAGCAYVCAAGATRQARLGRPGLLAVFGLGIVLRVAMCQPSPVPGHGVDRYLWDGAVTAHRINPYAYAPRDVAKFKNARDATPHLLVVLRAASGGIYSRIERPWLQSWHPPLTQAIFAGTYLLRPWSPIAWRVVLALFDVATLVLLVSLVRRLRFPPALLAVYWWNPLLIFETYSVGRLDILPLPLVVGALVLSLRGRTLYAALLLALAGGIRLWPIALLPLVLVPLRRQPRALLVVLAASLALLAVAWLPLLGHGLGEASGLLRVLRDPQPHGGIHTLLLWLALTVGPAANAATWARCLTALLLAVWVVLLARGTAEDAVLFCDRALLAVAGTFLLSPWPLPWLALGVTPLLVMAPRLSFLLLTPLLFLH